MNNNLIDKLSKLKLEETCVKRNLDRYYRDANKRKRLFARLKEVQKEISSTKFKIRLEREMKNEE